MGLQFHIECIHVNARFAFLTEALDESSVIWRCVDCCMCTNVTVHLAASSSGCLRRYPEEGSSNSSVTLVPTHQLTRRHIRQQWQPENK